MNMKKSARYLAALLAAMLLGLCACSAQKAPTEATDTPAAANEAAPATEAEEGGSEPEPADTEPAVRTITDGNGREVEIPEAVESIVCVGVGALRYSCYMQAQDLVVGVEDYETKAGMSRLYNYVNFDKFSTLPVTGTNGEPFVEEIIHVNPQVIVMSSYANVDPDELQSKTGIPVSSTISSQCSLCMVLKMIWPPARRVSRKRISPLSTSAVFLLRAHTASKARKPSMARLS